MRDSKNNGWLIFLFFLIATGVVGSGAIFPLIAIAAIVIAIAFAASKSANKNDVYSNGYRRTTTYRRTSTAESSFSAAETARINVYLRQYFRTHKSLQIGTSLDLKVNGPSYASMRSLDVYRDDTFICTLEEFERRYPDSYREIVSKLIKLSTSGSQESDVIDVEAVEKPEETAAEPQDKGAQYYIDTINTLNNNIPDEEITKGLYETTSLLKQIQALELKFPKSKAKLAKLYDYYLPILIRVLTQFENLQDAKYDENYEPVKAKLNKTIQLINDAMRTIISSMTDEDMMNLSADLSTLEAVLQKDGLTGDQMKAQPKDGDQA